MYYDNLKFYNKMITHYYYCCCYYRIVAVELYYVIVAVRDANLVFRMHYYCYYIQTGMTHARSV